MPPWSFDNSDIRRNDNGSGSSRYNPPRTVAAIHASAQKDNSISQDDAKDGSEEMPSKTNDIIQGSEISSKENIMNDIAEVTVSQPQKRGRGRPRKVKESLPNEVIAEKVSEDHSQTVIGDAKDNNDMTNHALDNPAERTFVRMLDEQLASTRNRLPESFYGEDVYSTVNNERLPEGCKTIMDFLNIPKNYDFKSLVDLALHGSEGLSLPESNPQTAGVMTEEPRYTGKFSDSFFEKIFHPQTTKRHYSTTMGEPEPAQLDTVYDTIKGKSPSELLEKQQTSPLDKIHYDSLMFDNHGYIRHYLTHLNQYNYRVLSGHHKCDEKLNYYLNNEYIQYIYKKFPPPHDNTQKVREYFMDNIPEIMDNLVNLIKNDPNKDRTPSPPLHDTSLAPGFKLPDYMKPGYETDDERTGGYVEDDFIRFASLDGLHQPEKYLHYPYADIEPLYQRQLLAVYLDLLKTGELGEPGTYKKYKAHAASIRNETFPDQTKLPNEIYGQQTPQQQKIFDKTTTFTKVYERGSRKTSVALVYLEPGNGHIIINNRDGYQYVRYCTQRIREMLEPLDSIYAYTKFNVIAVVHGGGITGQAGAIRHALSRYITKILAPKLEPYLSMRDLTRADTRQVERKKTNLRKARKKEHYSKPRAGFADAIVIDTEGEVPSKKLAKKIRAQQLAGPLASRGAVERTKLQKLISKIKSKRDSIDIDTDESGSSHKRESDDIWGKDAEPVVKRRPKMPSIAKIIPAVAAPHAGQSYNPTPESHAELIDEAVEALPKSQPDNDKPLSDMIQNVLPDIDVDILNLKQKQLLANLIIQDKLDDESISKALDEIEDDDEKDSEDDNMEARTASRSRKMKRKTRAQRNRQKLHKEMLKQALKRKRMKRLVHDIDRLNLRNVEETAEEENMEGKEARLRRYLENLIRGKTALRYGNKVYKADPHVVALSDEIKSCLRQLETPTRSAVDHVVDSIYRRGFVPAPPVFDEQYRRNAKRKLLKRCVKYKSKLLHVNMFKYFIVEDLISLEVSEYLCDAHKKLTTKVDDKYVDKVIVDVGLVVLVEELLVLSEPKILPNDASALFTLKLKLLVFSPERDQILNGTIISSDSTGISVSLGFFSDVKLLPLFLPENTSFDRDTATWFTEDNGTKLYYKNNTNIKFKVVEVTYNELNDLPEDDQMPVMLVIGTPA
ncbi:30S ribosomal protein S9 [Babesia sp. Xinjiang]|uniref:30S ribosomal protein S9 n=1 Tax=Babesia sp. Xinjiang TaxID=462227 RepID=UPI000A23FD9E|nr:30S ribosomal protein S9 [Babesia sp. Xinjiang]ORM41942.1 30S ribosomal protein S9 [Babesia sp. Xinjiang]